MLFAKITNMSIHANWKLMQTLQIYFEILKTKKYNLTEDMIYYSYRQKKSMKIAI